jgi:hypothetical protein
MHERRGIRFFAITLGTVSAGLAAFLVLSF